MKIDKNEDGSYNKHSLYYINRLMDAAKEFRERILVSIVQSGGDNQKEMDELGFKGKETGFVIDKASTRQRFVFDKAFKAQTIKKFFQDFVDGNLEAYVKSEEPPKNNNGPVKIVTGKTFDKIVKDDTKDVLIEFYAPWCGHCKQLEPKYKTLGEKFESIDTVTIAKMDATANDYPTSEFQVQGYPTIFLKPAGRNSKPVLFEGKEREVNDLLAFIKKNSKSGWSFPKGGKKDTKKDKKKKKNDDDDDD